jgi:hypothetical protein
MNAVLQEIMQNMEPWQNRQSDGRFEPASKTQTSNQQRAVNRIRPQHGPNRGGISTAITF